MGQAGVDHDPWLCITFPVGNFFSARFVAHLERLPGPFDFSYDIASQSTFFCSVFFSVPIFSIVAVRGVIDRLLYGYYHICGYFTSMLGFFL